MFIFGLIFYFGIPALIYFLPFARDFVLQSYALSPEITVMVFAAYVYPLLVFLMSLVFPRGSLRKEAYFQSQVNLAASFAVSFGLIGTFIGLAEMIAGIAAGMGADGDFSEKMAALLGAISSALDAMSYAFLTSILGVGSSVAIMFSANYLLPYYKRFQGEEDEDEEVGGITRGGLRSLNEAVQESMDLMASKEQVWSDFNLMLKDSSGSKATEQLVEVLTQNNQLTNKVAHEIQAMRALNEKRFEEGQDILKNFTSTLSHEMIQLGQNLETMAKTAIETGEQATKNTKVLGEVIDKNLEGVNGILESLNDIRRAIAPPLAEALKAAIRDNLLELEYQPQMNQNGKIAGAEAFLRWEDGSRGMVNNAELFEVATESGLLVNVDKWVMEAALRQLAQWIQAKQWQDQWVLSINLSAEHLLHPSFITYLESMLGKYQVPAVCLGLEITENIIMENGEACADKLRQIRSLGVQTFIDDFGTGFSSLTSLKALQVNKLKIDRSIVHDLAKDGDDSVIRSIMSMAQGLKVEVSAEGIESKEQIKKLEAVGCKGFQGYYLGRPAKADRFVQQFLQ